MEETVLDPRGTNLWLSLTNPSLTSVPTGNFTLTVLKPERFISGDLSPDFSKDCRVYGTVKCIIRFRISDVVGDLTVWQII